MQPTPQLWPSVSCLTSLELSFRGQYNKIELMGFFYFPPASRWFPGYIFADVSPQITKLGGLLESKEDHCSRLIEENDKYRRHVGSLINKVLGSLQKQNKSYFRKCQPGEWPRWKTLCPACALSLVLSINLTQTSRQK